MIGSLPWIVVPGLGLINRGRPVRGVLYFALFACALNARLISPLLLLEPWARSALLWTAVAVWVGAAADYLFVLAKRDDE